MLIKKGNREAFFDVSLIKVTMSSNGKVDCYDKGLYFIPEDIDEDTHSLLLAYNKINSLKTMSFYKYPNLKHLELQNNIIFSIHHQTFQNLKNLTYLDLSSNQLMVLRPEIFQALSSLTTLNLGNNRISWLPGNVLESLTNLQVLHLHSNYLTGLRVDILYKLPSLVELRLDGNPWACTCHIQYLLSWMIDHSEKIYEKQRTLCGIPKYLNQYPVLQIQRSSFDHCQDFITLYEYLYFLLIGIALFSASIVLCLLTGVTVVFYNRQLLQARQRPHVYKNKAARKREDVIHGHYLPTC
ncbi:PREDICTED: leucine-rich repeat-containing protein 26 [Nanorana parkeri]|uniref:leucine-rich repeat-containing protein 26 n=1 Tax=Nanorana parkeri TaxID=125878 RepID=UPI000854DD3D|nr:PREDICTED: leucine-rich repeat-containing protein 26 [Nanorana parkeri]